MIILLFFLFVVVFLSLYHRYGILSFTIFITGLWWFGIDTVDRFIIPRVSLSLLMCVSTVIFLLIFKRKYVINKNQLNKPLYLLQKLFALIIFLGLFGLFQYSKDIFNGTYYLLNSTVLPYLLLWLMWVLINSDEELELVVKLFFFTTTLFTIVLLYNFFNKLFDETSLINTNLGNRLGGSPTFPFQFHVQYDPVGIAVVLSNIFPLFLTYMLYKSKKHFSFAYFIPLLIIVITIFFTGTRSAWIAMSVASFFIMAYGKINKAHFKLIFAFLLFIAIIYNIFSYEINTVLLGRINSLQAIESDSGFLYRVEMLYFGLDVLLVNPLGIGFGRMNRIIMNEHNYYFFLGLGIGVIGIILYLIVIKIMLSRFIYNFKNSTGFRKDISLGGIAVILSFFINGFASNSIAETYQTNGLFITLGLILGINKIGNIKKKNDLN